MQIFTGSSGCSLVQKLPEFTRGERNAPAVEDAFIFNKSSDYASQMECGHGRIETRECRILPADAVEDEEIRTRWNGLKTIVEITSTVDY